MTTQVSTGFKSKILGPYSFASIFNGGHILVYDGVRPATADGGYAGAPLGFISRNGLPLGVGEPATLRFFQSGPYITQPYTDILAFTALRDGHATWFRLFGPTPDDNSTSYALPRIDGDVSLAAGTGELRMPSLDFLANDAVRPVSFFYSIPPIVGA